jgi:hypothetical protein
VVDVDATSSGSEIEVIDVDHVRYFSPLARAKSMNVR